MTALQPNVASDAEMLHPYAASKSPDAFAGLVHRYLPLIYSAALRQTRDPDLAEDVAQSTLLILSQKAAQIDAAILPGWIIKATHYVARNAQRERSRRLSREQRAAAMKSEILTPNIGVDTEALSRVIDPALARLRDVDRTAVILRYFENKSFADIAAHLQTTESAAQRRIARAIEKLRGILSRQGVSISPAVLPVALAAQALHTVPSSLTLKALAVPSSQNALTSLIAKGALHAMAATKIKVTVAVVAVVLLASVAVPVVHHFASAPAVPKLAATTGAGSIAPAEYSRLRESATSRPTSAVDIKLSFESLAGESTEPPARCRFYLTPGVRPEPGLPKPGELAPLSAGLNRVDLSDFPDGTHTLYIVADEYAPQWIPVKVKDGQIEDQTLFDITLFRKRYVTMRYAYNTGSHEFTGPKIKAGRLAYSHFGRSAFFGTDWMIWQSDPRYSHHELGGMTGMFGDTPKLYVFNSSRDNGFMTAPPGSNFDELTSAPESGYSTSSQTAVPNLLLFCHIAGNGKPLVGGFAKILIESVSTTRPTDVTIIEPTYP